MTPNNMHPGDSHVQREAERVIREALQTELGLQFGDTPTGLGLKLDGFADGERPVCVEIWAHQGTAKPAQKNKVMADMCKLLLAEHLLQRPCRKIFVVSDRSAISFLDGSWRGRFAETSGIETRVVGIPEDLRSRIRDAQRRQYR